MHEPKRLTEAQARTLREVLRGHNREAMFLLALATGMRRDELVQLTWQEVDLAKREMCIHNRKTPSSSRLIHLTEEVIEVLRQHRLRQTKARVKAGTAWQDRDLVFPDQMGGLLSPHQLVKEFDALLEQAALPLCGFTICGLPGGVRCVKDYGYVLPERDRTVHRLNPLLLIIPSIQWNSTNMALAVLQGLCFCMKGHVHDSTYEHRCHHHDDSTGDFTDPGRAQRVSDRNS